MYTYTFSSKRVPTLLLLLDYKFKILKIGVLLGLALVIGSCTTLSVKTPDIMYLSSGDYVPGIKTEGIIQAHILAWTPLLVLFDESKIREDLYKKLIDKVDDLVGVAGVSNVTFYSKPSPFAVLAIPTFGIGIWMDYYIEGVVFTEKK